jgi:hypothetical protein
MLDNPLPELYRMAHQLNPTVDIRIKNDPRITKLSKLNWVMNQPAMHPELLI